MGFYCEDATGLSRGVFTIAAKYEIKTPKFQMPRACPVELHVWSYIAANLSLHGQACGIPDGVVKCLGIAASVNPPRDKPVASRR